jgi:predicted ATPase
MGTQVYGQALQENPDDCIWVIMENFNSLGVFTKGTKINSLNKLCRQFNTNILARCKTQADWRQVTNEQQFRNLIGVGMETRSVVDYNINKWMQRNQRGGCAIMEMGQFSAKVSKTRVDSYKLGCWC